MFVGGIALASSIMLFSYLTHRVRRQLMQWMVATFVWGTLGNPHPLHVGTSSNRMLPSAMTATLQMHPHLAACFYSHARCVAATMICILSRTSTDT